MTKQTSLSIIIPVGPKEIAWKAILGDLLDELKKESASNPNFEILIVSPEKEPSEFQEFRDQNDTLSIHLNWLKSQKGRAVQLNHGASHASGEFLWFLHADTRLSRGALRHLMDRFQKWPNALLYFDLRFLEDGPQLMRVNERGLWFRSHILGIPFGDQGLAISKEQFQAIRGFPENVPYGEDHLFIWRARQQGMALKPAQTFLYTSARRYHSQGWLKTTLRYMGLTAWQATPEVFELMKKKLKRANLSIKKKKRSL